MFIPREEYKHLKTKMQQNQRFLHFIYIHGIPAISTHFKKKTSALFKDEIVGRHMPWTWSILFLSHELTRSICFPELYDFLNWGKSAGFTAKHCLYSVYMLPVYDLIKLDVLVVSIESHLPLLIIYNQVVRSATDTCNCMIWAYGFEFDDLLIRIKPII